MKRILAIVPITLLVVLLLAWPGPAAPQVNNHSVALTCTASTSPTAVGYNFYRGTVSGGPYTKLNTVSVAPCAFNDTTGVAGTKYFYVATALDSSGSESPNSNESSATFLGPPAPPTALAAAPK